MIMQIQSPYRTSSLTAEYVGFVLLCKPRPSLCTMYLDIARAKRQFDTNTMG